MRIKLAREPADRGLCRHCGGGPVKRYYYWPDDGASHPLKPYCSRGCYLCSTGEAACPLHRAMAREQAERE
jgi:hypothetical protein